MNPDGNAQQLDSKLLLNLAVGDTFRHELPGGGGWGDPLERDPQAVLEDVRNEFVSRHGAREEYGVVIAEETLAVDETATASLRESMRQSRGAEPLPTVCWN